MRWTLPNLVSDKKKGVSRNSPHQFHQLPYLIKPKQAAFILSAGHINN